MVRPVSYVVIAFIIAAVSLIAMLLMRNLTSGSAEQVTNMQLSKHDQHEATEMTEVAVKGKELLVAYLEYAATISR